MTLLLGFTGRATSGKNTAANFVSQWGEARGLSVVQRGFADAVKWSAARVFNPEISQKDAIKWADAIKFNHHFEYCPDDWSGPPYTNEERSGLNDNQRGGSINGRQFLQHYGTEAHRDIFGDDFWVNHLLPLNPEDIEGNYPPNYQEWSEGWGFPDIAVVTDLRFDNEAHRVEDLNGYNVRIIRGKELIDSHSSEAGVDSGYLWHTIYNNGTLDELKIKVFDMMDYLKKDGAL
jgi:hypothetical protein